MEQNRNKLEVSAKVNVDTSELERALLIAKELRDELTRVGIMMEKTKKDVMGLDIIAAWLDDEEG
ncbi:hypothetical protein ACFVVQ_13435 [Paenibacillus chitinolyticus]|uniref:hypothetical protein n=1 Tax=Paenibacillus chitinolyticus TaxID=79263 RepID=UPI0036DABC14